MIIYTIFKQVDYMDTQFLTFYVNKELAIARAQEIANRENSILYIYEVVEGRLLGGGKIIETISKKDNINE